VLNFDEAKHEYTFNGRVVPSVTQILKPLSEHEYKFVSSDLMTEKAALGTAVHKMIELDICGSLDVDSLHELVAPYYPMWKAFLAQSGVFIKASEQRLYSEKYGFAGTLDLFAELNGHLCVIDAKRTAAVPKTAGPQTAAYELAAREYYDIPLQRIDRYALHFTDKKWQLVPFKDVADKRVFLASLTLHNWKSK
jgi:hypothetical protein